VLGITRSANHLVGIESAGATAAIANVYHLPKLTLERLVLDAGGVVIRYGQFYGPGIYNPDSPPSEPRVNIVTAAARTVGLLAALSGIVTVVDT
jgi:hypothetical protein